LSAEKSHLYTREANNADSNVLDVQGDMHKKREHCETNKISKTITRLVRAFLSFLNTWEFFSKTRVVQAAEGAWLSEKNGGLT